MTNKPNQEGLLNALKRKFNATQIIDNIRESDYYPKAFRSPNESLTVEPMQLKCANCGAVTTVKTNGGYLALSSLNGWTFTTETGWTCCEKDSANDQ